MVLGKLPVPERPTHLDNEGQGPTVLTVGASGFFKDIFLLFCPFFLLSYGRRSDTVSKDRLT